MILMCLETYKQPSDVLTQSGEGEVWGVGGIDLLIANGAS